MHYKNTKVKTDPKPAHAAMLGLAAASFVRLQLSSCQSSKMQRLCWSSHSGLEVAPKSCS